MIPPPAGEGVVGVGMCQDWLVRRLPDNKRLTPWAQELRGALTPAERELWYQFLNDQPVRWMRQRPIGQYIADFYCALFKLIIELDGSQHYTPEGLARDAARTVALEQFGVRVIRFSNHDVMHHFDAVCEQITIETTRE